MNAIVRIAPEPDDVTAISDDRTITAWEVRQRLLAASRRIHNGHFAMTFNAGDDNETYVTHWYKPDQHAFQDCRTVAHGTLRHCLDAVDAYASRWVAEHETVPAVAAE